MANSKVYFILLAIRTKPVFAESADKKHRKSKTCLRIKNVSPKTLLVDFEKYYRCV